MKSPATSAGPRIETPAAVEPRPNRLPSSTAATIWQALANPMPGTFHELVEVRAPQRHDIAKSLEKPVGEG